MIPLNAGVFVLVTLSLNLAQTHGSPTSSRNEITYATKVSPPLKQKEQLGFYDETSDNTWIPESKVLTKYQDPTHGNFYDPTYGFSPEVVSDSITQHKDSKTEPILTAVLVNSKDYYRLFECNNPKVHFDKNTNHQMTSQEVAMANSKHFYPVPTNTQEPVTQFEHPIQNSQNNAGYLNRVEKREQTDTADPYYYRGLSEVDEKYLNAIKSKPIPYYFKNTSDRKYNPTYTFDSTVPQVGPAEDSYQDKQKTLDQLLEEFNALAEQIQRLKSRTESELNRPRVRRGRPRPVAAAAGYRWGK